MPLSKIQTCILRVLASQRDPESYVAGATPLNRDAPRFSADIDVFHDREERVASAALADAQALEAAGYRVHWHRRSPALHAAEISMGDDATRLEWVVDSDFRFFPVMPDALFGYVLHRVDLALNKIMAAVGRREVRDLVDLLMVHQTILPIGALAWAAAEKSPGYNPEGLIAEIRRNSNYPAAEWHALISTEPVDPKATLATLRSALDEAEAFIGSMPSDKSGLLFLQGARVVQPDSTRLEAYRTHAGRRLGQWPSSPEITAAMFERSQLHSDL